uniref:SAM domain-containing protein n=1 Tax=Tetraselmis sp. GSL018 TaxID=582737 RepID=A0A061S7L4_9CHLO|mmetsp:Transcript_33759/g.80116  ORF Transcript_33759/g.80116 Transcript_33759/m.80116 type:complete len:143 (-) Transcript_33759:344-772(-)
MRDNNVDGPVLLTLSIKDLTQEMSFSTEEALDLLQKRNTWADIWDRTRESLEQETPDGLTSLWSLSANQVCEWAQAEGFGHRSGALAANNVDGVVLLTLSKRDLAEELGFTENEATEFLERVHHCHGLLSSSSGTGEIDLLR